MPGWGHLSLRAEFRWPSPQRDPTETRGHVSMPRVGGTEGAGTVQRGHEGRRQDRKARQTWCWCSPPTQEREPWGSGVEEGRGGVEGLLTTSGTTCSPQFKDLWPLDSEHDL